MGYGSGAAQPSSQGQGKALPPLSFILPNVSVSGLSKVALNEIKILRTKINVISLVKERREFPKLTQHLKIKYPVQSEILSRVMYPHYITSLHLAENNVIVAHNIPSTIVASRLQNRETRLPYIAYIHDDQISIHGTVPKFEQSEIKESLDNAGAILANSRTTAAKIETAYGAKFVKVLYPGCLPSSQIPEKRENFYLVVHMISLSKNFEILYELLKRNRDIRVVIAGAKKYLWQAVYIKFKIKFGSRVHFVLDPTDEELSQLYRRSKMLLHTAVENFGMSPLEAGGHGTPSIAVRGSGIIEVLKEDKEIFCFDQNDVEELDNLIRDLSSNSAKLHETGLMAWQKAQRFDWNYHAELLTRTIRETV